MALLILSEMNIDNSIADALCNCFVNPENMPRCTGYIIFKVVFYCHLGLTVLDPEAYSRGPPISLTMFQCSLDSGYSLSVCGSCSQRLKSLS